MLIKRIDLGSIPLGLYETGAELEKGRAVTLKDGKIVYPSSAEEEVLGFVTLRIDYSEGGDIVDHNTIPEGKKAVVYTAIKNNIWGTTEVVKPEELKVGDYLEVETQGEDAGKFKKAGGETAYLVTDKYFAGSFPAVDFKICK